MKVKYERICILLLIMLLTVAVPAYAGKLETSGITIELPDSGNVYYMTQDETNMRGDMLQSAREEENLVLSVGVYDENEEQQFLHYFLKLYEEEGTNTAAKMEQLRGLKGYLFDEEITQHEVALLQAEVLTGTSANDPAYAVRMYVFSNGGRTYTLNLAYKITEDDVYLNEAVKQAETLALSANKQLPPPTHVATQTAQPSTSPTSVVSTNPVVTLAPMPTQQAQYTIVFSELGQEQQLLICGIGGSIIVMLIILIIVLIRNRRKAKRAQKEQINSGVYYEPQPAVNQYRESPPRRIEPEAIVPTVRNQPPEEEWPQERLWQPLPQMEVNLAHLVPEQGVSISEELLKAYEMKNRRAYIFAAKMFHDIVKRSNDKTISKAADLQIVECLIEAKQYKAALKKAGKIFYKDYAYTLEERSRLKLLVAILKKK